MRFRSVAAITLVLVCGVVTIEAIECVTIAGPKGQAGPIVPQAMPVVPGAVCGRAFLLTVPRWAGKVGQWHHRVELLELHGGELELRDVAGTVVARATIGPDDRFEFPSVPTGRYTIGWLGVVNKTEPIEVVSVERSQCKRPLRVFFRLADECQTPSGVMLDR